MIFERSPRVVRESPSSLLDCGSGKESAEILSDRSHSRLCGSRAVRAPIICARLGSSMRGKFHLVPGKIERLSARHASQRRNDFSRARSACHTPDRYILADTRVLIRSRQGHRACRRPLPIMDIGRRSAWIAATHGDKVPAGADDDQKCNGSELWVALREVPMCGVPVSKGLRSSRSSF